MLNVAKMRFPQNEQISSTLANIEKDGASNILAAAIKQYQAGNFTEALNLYLAIKPATKDSTVGTAACYQGLNQFDKAISYYKQAEKLSPDDAQIKYYIGAMYTEIGDYNNAGIYLRQVSKQVPQANELLNFINQKSSMETLESAIKDFENGNYEDSLVKISEVLDKDPNNSYAYYYRGMVYDAKNERIKAIEDYKKVLNLSPDLVIANYLMAVDYDALQKFEEAYKSYSNFLNNYSNEDEYKTYSQKRLEDLKPYATKE